MAAKPLMVQGTMSGVGKSLLVAGLCRVLAQDGLRVAPFKSQNMALNSHITAAGDEIGRAQAVQAAAAGIEPEAAMNPILLKPTTDVGSQVIVNGRVLGNMTAREYFAFKERLVPDIRRAYGDLASRFDVVVIEGAGSPAEVNLKDGDIVNMGMAKLAASPVLLVGDIDRGGVFAQLLGTMMLLDADERAHVKALVVNKFRGDASILEPGLDILRERAGVPVAGVVPFALLDIDDEDSLSERLDARGAGGTVDIAVVRLPRISNFTDFAALAAVEGVGVRYVSRVRDLREPDLVILPGTKSTLADLTWLRESGFEAAVCKLASRGVPVFGICGGFQMLGADLSDPHGVEGGGSMRGLGLLPVRTVFAGEKTQRRVSAELGAVGGVFAGLSGVKVEGYEIHMGETESDPCAWESGGPGRGGASAGRCGSGEGAPVLEQFCFAGQPAGLLVHSGNVYGTYVHGFFDGEGCARAVVSALAEGKGVDAGAMMTRDMAAYREEQYDRLADLVRANLDMDLVRRILEEGM